MRRQQQTFRDLGAEVAVVSFEPPEQTVRFGRSMGLPFTMLSDPSRRAYAAFGLQRGEHEQVWSWATAKSYLGGLRRGQLPRLPRGDLEQLGGDFVISPTEMVVFAYRGATPADRPSVEVLLAAVEEAAASPGRHTSP